MYDVETVRQFLKIPTEFNGPIYIDTSKTVNYLRSI